MVERATAILNGRLLAYCEVHGCEEEGTDWHHCFGRTSPGEPWASWRHLTTLLCWKHHQEVTGQLQTGLNKELRLSLKVTAAQRVHRSLALSLPGQLTLFDSQGWQDWLKLWLQSMKSGGQLPPEYEALPGHLESS